MTSALQSFGISKPTINKSTRISQHTVPYISFQTFESIHRKPTYFSKNRFSGPHRTHLAVMAASNAISVSGRMAELKESGKYVDI